MQSKWLGRIGLTALVMGVVGSSSGMIGCASERDPINRVQLNAIPKSFLLGQDYESTQDDPEFYARSMLIQVPYGQSGGDEELFTNSINSVSKIKWQIQETKLVGRVSFERIINTDTQGTGTTVKPSSPTDRDPTKQLGQNDGLVVYEFAIEKQFDIRRAYNSTTGEESNVIEENDSDRAWTNRDYIRVDFSKNLVTTAYDFDTLSLLGVYNAIDYAPLEFDIRDPNDVNAPQFDLDGGYFDVTNKLFANPKEIDFGDGFKFPGCMLPNLISGGTQPSGNCNPNELTIRHSFRKVVDTDYEPISWDGFKQEAYGAFQTERQGYARDYGLTDAQWFRFISRYNIWERNHFYTDSANMQGATKCVTDSECSGIGTVAGMSHCDTYNNKCTLPFHDRVAKPIVWHYADGSPDLYFDSNREATEEWDTAMRGAVVAAKYAECKRYTPDQDCGTPITGNFAQEEDSLYLVKEINACKRGDVAGTDPSACDALADTLGAQRGYSDQVIALAKMKPMVMLCHSPVTDKDATECGKIGSIARLGDLRYHLVTAIATPETNSPWGIMSDSNDPTTGEHIAASINVWTHVDDLWSRGIVDTMRYIAGELKTEDVTDGKYIDQWVEAMRQQKGGGLTPLMGQDEIDKRVAAAGNTTVEHLHAIEKLRKNPSARTNNQAKLEKQLLANLKRVSQTKGAVDAPSINAPLYQARMNMAIGTPLEAEMTSPAMQQLASSGFGSVALDPNMKDKAVSIFQGLNPQTRRAFAQRKEMNLAARGACIMSADEATAPLGYVALADIIQEKFGKFSASDAPNVQAERADKMKDYLRRRVHYAVVAHEMGHSIALRHNFVSSSDAWNFRPQYWALRTNGKKLSNTPCAADGTSDGKSCVGPRWLDPVTANEQKNLVELWAHSSTMEYPGEPTQDLLALGAYDFGAARMFYGQVGTVYDTSDKRFNSAADAGATAQAHQGDFGGLLGYRYGTDFSNPIHYSQLDGSVNLIEKCSTVDMAAFKPVTWNDAKDGAWHGLIDGHIVTNEDGKPTRCTQPKVDFVQWDTLKSTDDKSHAHDNKDRVRVPHGYASDDWADLGNVAVYRHDNGADTYETMQFWLAQQEVTHIFTNYRRGRRDFSIYGAFNRTLSRYHEKMRDSAKSIALYITLARDTVTEYNSGDDPQGFVATILKQVAVDNTVASSIAFDHFAHVFSRPEPGDHGVIGKNDPVLRSVDGTAFANPPTRVALSVANGVTGGFGTISLGGRPIENALANNTGRDYDRDYTLNVGSYYEKAFTAMLFTESADNFISASRDDFVDPRFRSVSIADVFPDGYRRWLANNLTGDDTIKGVYARGTGTGTGPQPADLDPNGYALLGSTSWWPTQGIETCFPQGEKITCRDPFATTPVGGTTGSGPVIDPQVGWEQQKFALVQSLIYLPENDRVNWIDQMNIYEMGVENDPGFENRIEFHNADGHIYVAQTYGTEVLYGKTVQKGIGARILEYANSLLVDGVVTDPIVNKSGVTIGYMPKLDALGNVQYKNNGAVLPVGSTCDQSKSCLKMQNYVAIPKLMRESLQRFGRTRNSQDLKGVY